jgi:hypothetical protein
MVDAHLLLAKGVQDALRHQARHFKLFFAEVRDRVLDSGRLDTATFDAASGLLDDPDYWTQCWTMTAVWARKPAA